jgi:hypothetical protein
MRKYARELGQEHGLTAQEMNAILKKNGFLDGEPGNYNVTEKGKKYAEEQNHSCEVGGRGRCNGPWITRKWDERIADELENDGLAIESDIYSNEKADSTDANNDALVKVTIALFVASAYGIYKATPYINYFWHDKAVPSLKKMKNKVTGEAEKTEEETELKAG